jgi:vacuolar-type H+-ATPase subunit I/STV1
LANQAKRDSYQEKSIQDFNNKVIKKLDRELRYKKVRAEDAYSIIQNQAKQTNQQKEFEHKMKNFEKDLMSNRIFEAK